MHVGRGQETVVMGNSHGQSKSPKKWFGKDKQETQNGTSKITQPTFTLRLFFEHQTQEPSKLSTSILYSEFDLNCNVSNMQYIIHKM